MKKLFSVLKYFIFIVFGLIIGVYVSGVGNVGKWVHGDFGSVAEWFSGFATIIVLAITIWRTENANKPRVFVSVNRRTDSELAKNGGIYLNGGYFEIFAINYGNSALPLVFMGIHDPDRLIDKYIPKRFRKRRNYYYPDPSDMVNPKDFVTIDPMHQSEKIIYPVWSVAQYSVNVPDNQNKKFCITYMDMYGNEYNSYFQINGKAAKDIMK